MASLLVRTSPSPVEYELAPTVGLLVQDKSGAKLVIGAANAQMAWGPARVRRDRSTGLGGEQKLVAKKWKVVSGDTVPVVGRDTGNAVVDGDPHRDTVPSGMFVEEFLCVERCHATGTRRGHGLAVYLVRNITRREYARNAGRRCVSFEAGLDNDVVIIHVELVLEESGVGTVADRDEYARQINLFRL